MEFDAEEAFRRWLDALEARHLAELTLPEVRRAVQALSGRYVSGRDRLGDAFAGAGNRAAYAMYFAPLHYLTLRHVIVESGLARVVPRKIVDLGCGTGVGAAAWAIACDGVPGVAGVDRSGWAVAECRWNWRQLGLSGSPRRGSLETFPLPGAGSAIVAGWSLNELDPAARRRLADGLIAAVREGASLLVVEPIATRVTPWWEEWCAGFQEVGGQSAEWKFAVELPELLRRMDRAAGLRHDRLRCRSLVVEAR